MKDLPPTREFLPWSLFFGALGVALGIVESMLLRLTAGAGFLVAAVFLCIGYGFGFDVATRRRKRSGQSLEWQFWVISALIFIFCAATVGAGAVFLSGIRAAIKQ